MKVYVTTYAAPFQPEIFIDVSGSRKAAEKVLRAEFPHMRKTENDPNCFLSDKRGAVLLFIHEKEVL